MASQTYDFAPNGWQGALNLSADSLGRIKSSSNSSSGTRTPLPPSRNGIVVFSGGSAANNLVDLFNQVREANNTTLSYVVPISDNGGSSSELIRVFGGPGKEKDNTWLPV